MKLRISSSIFLFALITTPTFASQTAAMPTTTVTNPAKFYIGAFGGSGASNDINGSQLGTAFFTEADGGPLAVNAFGELSGESASFYGFQLGYQAQEILLNSSSQWAIAPAAELEGLSMNESTFSGNLVNDTVRLAAHDFTVSYPMSRTIFLANAVINFNIHQAPVHPYIGFGIGSAIVRIAGANATQTNPPEAGVNHYNSNTSDTNSTFAGQIKLGLSFDINSYVSLFADYRWLYLASTNFVFGSTVYSTPPHVETSSWQVKMDPQRYNMGNIGIRFRF